MNIVKIFWGKEGAVVDQEVAQCDCGSTMKEVGQFGCVIDDHSSSLMQCPDCKTVAQLTQRLHNSYQPFEENGWKQVNKKELPR